MLLLLLLLLLLCFWFLKGDQASIIGGVIEFIKELHQVLQSLESKKRRKSVSPSPGPSPRPVALQPSCQVVDHSNFGFEHVKELGACCNSPVADIEAKISGSNVVLKIISRRIPGQIAKIISVLERLSFDVLHLNISSMEDTVLYSFVIKVYIYHHKFIAYRVYRLIKSPIVLKALNIYIKSLKWHPQPSFHAYMHGLDTSINQTMLIYKTCSSSSYITPINYI
jgi:hypothetical protein